MPKIIDESRIYEAALDMLVAYGYEGATTKKIARAAGVNEVTLFRRYGTKAGLFEEAISDRFSDTPLNHIEYTGDLIADLTAIMQAYVQTNQTHWDVFSILLVEIPRTPELQGSFNAPWRNIQRLAGIIERYQDLGALRPESPLSCLSALLGPFIVSQMFRRARPDISFPKIEVLAYVETFLLGRAG